MLFHFYINCKWKIQSNQIVKTVIIIKKNIQPNQGVKTVIIIRFYYGSTFVQIWNDI